MYRDRDQYEYQVDIRIVWPGDVYSQGNGLRPPLWAKANKRGGPLTCTFFGTNPP